MEETLCIEGKTYMASSSAAKMVGYASDYVGQLCRGGKVEAIRVGRVWFVNIASLTAYSTSTDMRTSRQSPLSSEHISSTKMFSEKSFLSDAVKSGFSTCIESVFAILVCCALFVVGMRTFSGNSVMTLPTIPPNVFAFSEHVISEDVSAIVSLSGGQMHLGFGQSIAVMIYRGIELLASGVRIVLGKALYASLNILGFGVPEGVISDHVMVVVPAAVSEADNEEMKEKIKQSFSDPVDVAVEDDGTGIITPVFKSGKEDNYMFVMVPVGGE
ncbi:MAG: hypothetical protein HGB03_00075 [Candidatus Yonathbacteria bacterium]|nr:hypothetical protein [Candidatus Yonathbacteria bacterium]NTW48077.1 hypothetical protein [Candidatus Yonathbacteria bacterium]